MLVSLTYRAPGDAGFGYACTGLRTEAYPDNNFLNRDVFGAQQLSVFEVGENGEDPAVVIRPCFEVEL